MNTRDYFAIGYFAVGAFVMWPTFAVWLVEEFASEHYSGVAQRDEILMSTLLGLVAAFVWPLFLLGYRTFLRIEKVQERKREGVRSGR